MTDKNKMELVIVDDDELIVELIKRILVNDPIKVSGFSHQEDCLNYLSDAIPTFLFVDMRMPRIDGVKFLSMLQEQGINKKTKIYLCTGAVPTDDVVSLMTDIDVTLIEKENVCSKTWLLRTLGFSEDISSN